MTDVTTGSHLYSQVCTTEVIVIRVPAEPIDLQCGGLPLSATPTTPSGDVPEGPGSALGKRYSLESGLELLCVKPGPGTLTADGAPIPIQAAKALPASD